MPSAPMLRFTLLAILTGLVAGAGAVVFRALIALFHNVAFLGTLDTVYDTSVHTVAGPWGIWIILVPVVGALIVAFLVSKFAPEAKGHGVPEVIDAIYYGRGIIRPIVALIKALASALSIGTGAAIGREGPIIQIGAAFGSSVGQLLRVPHWQLVTLIAAGAGGGIAATFNTPIGGLLFAVELILPEISSRTLIPVALATGAATYVGRMAFGDYPAFTIPNLAMQATQHVTITTVGAYIAFGIALGLVSMIFTRSIYAFEDFFDRLPGNYYTRHSLGMLVVGIMMYLFLTHSGHYYIQGVGYATVQDILSQTLLNPAFLLLLFVAKLLATSLTLGSGGSGGIFSPSLFLGATLGAAYAAVIGHVLPGVELSAPTAAVIGMAGVVAGATGAVVTAIVMIFEMTRDYHIIIPLMISASVAYGVRRGLMRDNIYTLKLSRRGHIIPEALQTNLYLMHSVRDILDIPLLRRPLDDTAPLRRVIKNSRQPPHIIAVQDGRVASVVTAAKLRQIDPDLPINEVFERHGTNDFILVRAAESLLDAFMRMRDAKQNVAVVTESGALESADKVLGVVTWDKIARTSNLPMRLRQRKNSDTVSTPTKTPN